MNHRSLHLIEHVCLVGCLLLVFAAGCSPQAAPPEKTAPPAVTNTPPPPTLPPLPSLTPHPSLVAPTPPPPAPVHVLSPAAAEGKPQIIYDQVSEKFATQKRAYGGDDYSQNRLERPFAADMTYLPFLDIVQATLTRQKDNPWIYADLQLVGSPADAGSLQPRYGLELDTRLDGRGRYLIWAASPTGTNWTTRGVTVWEDTNQDVGGDHPVVSDTNASGNGYDHTLFEDGSKPDPDLAWVRLSPKNRTVIEFAFKNTLIGGETGLFLWGAWADAGLKDPARFDYHDRFTLEQAGSPLKELPQFYPLKALFALDNTCRAASGWTPKGGEKGICLNSAPEEGIKADKAKPGKVCTAVGCN